MNTLASLATIRLHDLTSDLRRILAELRSVEIPAEYQRGIHNHLEQIREEIGNYLQAGKNTVFCLEILGESSFHKYLVQSGWSGRGYVFRYNRPTHSHVRAYRRIEDYWAERVDIHKAANVWPLLSNLLPSDQIEKHVYAEPFGAEGGERRR